MYFFIKTQDPRPTFHLDMTPEERAIMERHVAYWSEKAIHGISIMFGAVLDSRGVDGIGSTKSETRQKCRTSSNTTRPKAS